MALYARIYGRISTWNAFRKTIGGVVSACFFSGESIAYAVSTMLMQYGDGAYSAAALGFAGCLARYGS